MNYWAKVAAVAFATGLVSGQTTNLSAPVADLEQKITVAVQSGDLVLARRSAIELEILLGKAVRTSTAPVSEQLAAAELQFATATPAQQFHQLQRICWLSIESSRLDKAETYGQMLLNSASQQKTSPAYADAVFTANTTLGQVAANRGDLARAVRLLLASIDPSPSVKLKAAGPRFDLANHLLQLGERDPVVQFLTKCKTFWTVDKGDLNTWIAAINGGATPTLANPRFYY